MTKVNISVPKGKGQKTVRVLQLNAALDLKPGDEAEFKVGHTGYSLDVFELETPPAK